MKVKEKPPHPVMVSIACQIVRRREYLGWSKAEVAARLSVPPNTYQQWELARNVIPVFHLPALARVLGVPVAYFFGEALPAPGSDPRITDLANALIALQGSDSNEANTAHEGKS